MWHCSSECTYNHIHCYLTCMTSPSPAQKTHLHPRVKWSVHLHLWNVSSLLFVICCLRFSFFRVTCHASWITFKMSHYITMHSVIYCTQTHYYPFTLPVFAIWYFLLLYLWLYVLRYFLFNILCLFMSTAYYLNLTFHNMQLSVLGMFRLLFFRWYFDVLHTKDFLFFIIHWILLTTYFSNLITQSSLFIFPSVVFDSKNKIHDNSTVESQSYDTITIVRCQTWT